MSAPLNTSEKTLLQYWLADGAPGYSKVVMNSQNQFQQVALTATDFQAIGALDNDIVRGFMSTYQVQKNAQLSNVSGKLSAGITKLNGQLTANQAIASIVSALVVQTTPTTGS